MPSPKEFWCEADIRLMDGRLVTIKCGFIRVAKVPLRDYKKAMMDQAHRLTGVEPIFMVDFRQNVEPGPMRKVKDE